MPNSKQSSLILRVSDSYFVQTRDNLREAHFMFPGALSLFGGELEGEENGEQGFFREMNEEIEGIDWEGIKLRHIKYNWRKDLERVEKEIDSYLEGNFSFLRGFEYSSNIPQSALGKDRGKEISYRELFESLDEDHYFIGEFPLANLSKVRINEGRGLFLREDLCARSIFYPTDKIALMHEIAKRETQ